MPALVAQPNVIVSEEPIEQIMDQSLQVNFVIIGKKIKKIKKKNIKKIYFFDIYRLVLKRPYKDVLAPKILVAKGLGLGSMCVLLRYKCVFIVLIYRFEKHHTHHLNLHTTHPHRPHQVNQPTIHPPPVK
jgi:hypothetical protein